MSLTATISKNCAPASVVLGYELLERLGVGGYGEVWKARAPGGLLKAVKIVYGHVDGERAARELKSLNRLGEVRHPFMLNIERIEVCDDRLIIVSELAEANLREVYEHHRAAGLRGVPRDKLLSYLVEAAEALDFLYEKLSLQHLDVKPDNILIVSDHAKIADFGLVKSIYDTGASLVNGLTPKYASPDVFEGRPSRYSDQYSLAVMYQEMVSGVLPFNGTTAAQLASQHLHLEPDLSSLDPRDRFAVAKALAKEPERRFASCREFVARLTKQNSARIVFPAANGKSAIANAAALPALGSNSSAGHDGATMVVAKPQIERATMPEIGAESAQYRPVLFVGLGGAGSDVLRALKQLIADRLPNAAAIPSVSMLYLDTDVQAINAACDPTESARLSNDEVLLLPLQNAQVYAANRIGQLTSLSRRWLYNVPKSLRTEGLRAVGRMALLDHTQRVLARLRRTLASITDRASLAASSEQSGLNFADYNPRVYIISSLTGGTGSGMLIDLAYAVRQSLAELGVSDDDVHGILQFGHTRGAATRLAIANAFACLRELNYFASPHHSYPGESLCGLAAFDEPSGPFKHTYVVELGVDLTQEQAAKAARRQAEYLFSSSLSPASKLLDACREQPASDSPTPFALRTFGIARFGDDGVELTSQLVHQLCQALIRRWRGGIDESVSIEAIPLTQLDRIVNGSAHQRVRANYLAGLAEQKLSETNLSSQRLTSAFLNVATGQLGAPPTDYFQTAVEQVLCNHEFNDAPSRWSKIVNVIEAVVGRTTSEDQGSTTPIQSLRTVLGPAAIEEGRAQGRQLAEWALDMVDDHLLRLGGARCVATELAQQVEERRIAAAADCKTCQEACDAYANEIATLLATPKQSKPASKSLSQCGQRFAQLQLQSAVAEALVSTFAQVESQLARATDELREYWSNLNRLAEQFPAAVVGAHVRAGAADGWREVFEQHEVEWVDRFDQTLQAAFCSSRLKLRAILSHSREQRGNLVAKMISVARQVLSAIQSELSIACWRRGEANDRCVETTSLLAACVDESQPSLLRVGGVQRSLLLVPATVQSEKLVAKIQALHGDRPTPLAASSDNIVLINEGEQLLASLVLDALIRIDPQCSELGERLHTRVDIDWRAGNLGC